MSRRERFLDLRNDLPVILPSLLQCDFANLQQEVARLERAGVRALHLDVMDGVFVPNLSYGMPVVAAFRDMTEMPLDVHLMIDRPERYVQEFYDAGADAITIHLEADADPRTTLGRIRDLGAASGLAMNPATPIESIEPLLDVCDLVLVMSVNAGFGGQAFDPVALEKLQFLRALAIPDLLLEVDGGINDSTIAQCANAGADLFVVGSAIFNHDQYAPVIGQLSDLAR